MFFEIGIDDENLVQQKVVSVQVSLVKINDMMRVGFVLVVVIVFVMIKIFVLII